MSTAEKPVVLVVDDNREWFQQIKSDFELEGNEVVHTPTMFDMLNEIHRDKNRRVAVLLSFGVRGQNSILAYLHNIVSHRAISIIIAENVEGDVTHEVRRFGAAQHHRSNLVLDKNGLWLPGLAFDINNTPTWDDKRKLLIDPLTGLENLQGFLWSVKPELEDLRDRRGRERSKDDRRKVHMNYASVLIIDANRLKLINDNFGHLKGDEAIVGIARAIQRHVRASHHACRKSGDEFLVWLPGYNLAQADRRGEILCSAISRIEFRDTNGELCELSAFFGKASIHASEIGEDVGVTLKELIERADQELLEKKAARNALEGKSPGER